ncbi:MAG: phage major capsid protein [Fimbriimonadaceae bacterium]|nr:phage major capsid protein [Fimbriimonadaceae bacterium]
METAHYEVKEATWMDNGVLEGYASVKGILDRAGDEIAPGAYLNLSALVDEGFGAVGHDATRLPVATIESAREDTHGLRVRMQFHSTPEAQAARTIAQERLARGKAVGLSIGFIPRSAERVMRDGRPVRRLTGLEVREVSLVTMPANPLAVATSVKEAPKTEPEMQSESQVETKATGRLTLAAPHRSLSLADAILDHSVWENRSSRGLPETELEVDVPSALELKTLFATTAGFAPMVDRSGIVVPSVQRPPQLVDFLPIVPTTQNAYKFMRETTFTNAANPKAEGAKLDEAALAYTEATTDIRRIGTTIPVTEEQMEDEAGMRALLQDRLTSMLRQSVDTQVTSGNGTAPNLRGILNLTGIQTQAKGSDPIIDAIAKAMNKVRSSGSGNGGASPNLVVFHPNDYLKLVLARTTDGQYIMGHPSDDMTRRLMGIAITQSEALSEGTALVMDSRFFPLIVRKGVTFAVSESHEDYFAKNTLVVRAHVRVGLASYRDAAACTVTGL